MPGRTGSLLKDEPEQDLLPVDYCEFADVFDKHHAKHLPPHCSHDLSIHIEGGNTPPLGPIYSLLASELRTLREFIDENTRTGLIRPLKSLYGVPVLFVKKKDGSLHLCVDYQELNRITCKDRYPIPLITDLLDTPKKARVYSKIDLRSAYHLVRIVEGDEWKTIFHTHYGSYEWLVMLFGLSNAPLAFQRFINELFSDLLDMCVVIYLDDILIYLDNISKHKRHVKEVLRHLCANDLYTSPSKCVFHHQQVKFLGYVLGPQGVQMDKSKVQVIQDWPIPHYLRDIQAFLDFANFYRHFIQNYSKITVLLICLTRKSCP